MIRRSLKKITHLNKSLVFRINILKGVCFLIFFIIAVQLYQAQVINADKYMAFLERGTTANLQENVPRGIITDRNGVVLVDNKAVDIITFQPTPDMSTNGIRKIASDLAELIEVDASNLTSRDLRDLFIIVFPDEARDLITAEEVRDLENSEIYRLQLDRIEDEHLEMLTDHDKETHVLFNNMNQGSNLLANTVKIDASQEEIAIVSENLPRLPGVGIGVDWDRIHPSDMAFSSIFGRVSSHDQGVPASRLNHFQAHGYERNARVGISQLEVANQGLLSGSPSQYVVEDGVATLLVEGQQGLELGLTIDVELQVAISDLVEQQLLDTRRNQATARYLQEAYVVMMDPNTGEILAMVGKVLRTNPDTGQLEVVDNSLGTFQSAFTVGSTVKAATWLSGVDSEAATINRWRVDSTLRFPGTNPISSHTTMGNINEVTALSRSSNIYFMRQILEMANVSNFTSDSPSLANFDVGLWTDMRHFFNDFGLGSSTGIDLPNESTGQRVTETSPSNLLQFGIGQSDTYTTMQLAQFASTLATNGKRYATTVVRDVYLPSNNPEERQLVQSFSPTLLNVVDIDDVFFDRVHEGHRQALVTGTGAGRFNGSLVYNPAGKTGTAQENARGSDGRFIRNSSGDLIPVHNRTFIGYAPLDNPEVAIAVIVPQNEQAHPQPSSPMSLDIANEAFQIYFNLQKERAQ